MRRFGLIGKTLKHSFSKNYFTQKFASEGISDCVYENFELESIKQFPSLFGKYDNLSGLNITIPYKEAIIPYLDQKNEAVSRIGACNCIQVTNKGLLGFNTDAPAFLLSLSPLLHHFHKKALILGSGGASKAVQFALHEAGLEFKIVSRSPSLGGIAYEDLDKDIIEDYHVIINTTPLGMFPNVDQDPPIPYEYLTSRHLLYDLTYNPELTRFLQKGKERGATVKNGHQMLVLQAEESWRIWNSA